MGADSIRRCVFAVVWGTALLAGVAGCGAKAVNDTFALSGIPEIAGPSAKNRQILVTEPSALKALDSEQIVVRVAHSEIQYLSKAQWSDRLPKLVQSKLVEAFENTGKLGGVGRPGEGLAIDYQIQADIRAFEIDATGGRAHIEISAKIINDRNGTVRGQQVFSASFPVSGSSNPNFVKALDAAFSRVTADIVGWTLKTI